MLTHKQRILMAARGEMPDVLPYVPRIDLWYNANSAMGTLPPQHAGRTQDEISRAEGWALHKVVPEFLQVERPEDSIHRALGLYRLKEIVFDLEFAPQIGIDVARDGDYTRVTYHTPVGEVSTRTMYSAEMRRAGASVTWIDEHIIKRPADYAVVGYLFEHLTLKPAFDRFRAWQRYVGEDGVACTMVGLACSPMHHIQKEFFDATEFYYAYSDCPKQMHDLAGSVGHFFDQALEIIAGSPAEMVLWGANLDDAITYAEYCGREITPWIRKASDRLGAAGKLALVHCDGENLGLMDLIRDSGLHVAEAICPFPMTKVAIEEYYARWGERLTIFGGIPSNILLPQIASEADFEAYLDHLFKVIAPGRRFIVGVADTTPPDAKFDRLVRIGERVRKEARLPLEGGAARPITAARLEQAAARVAIHPVAPADYALVGDDIEHGRHKDIAAHVQALLDSGHSPRQILDSALLSTMQALGVRFSAGEIFIAQMLLSARAMNAGLAVLEPHLMSASKEASGKILIGTVRGDFHDVGKNMVAIMLRGVGFDVIDLGVNLAPDVFVDAVRKYQPDLVALSALLTTTMAEMGNVIETLKANGLRDRVKIIVGGAPVNENFSRNIGADGYAGDAGEAAELAKKLIGRKSSAEHALQI